MRNITRKMGAVLIACLCATGMYAQSETADLMAGWDGGGQQTTPDVAGWLGFDAGNNPITWSAFNTSMGRDCFRVGQCSGGETVALVGQAGHKYAYKLNLTVGKVYEYSCNYKWISNGDEGEGRRWTFGINTSQYGGEETMLAKTTGILNRQEVRSASFSFINTVENGDVYLVWNGSRAAFSVDGLRLTETGTAVKVTFMDGEDVLSAQYIMPNTAVEAYTPEKAGYKFGGWYDNEGLTGDPFDFSTNLSENTTLYAKWVDTKAALKGLIETVGMPREGSTLAAVLVPAKAVVEKEDASEDEINNAYNALELAWNGYTVKTLSDLTVDGTTIAGFAPDVYTYGYMVATAETTVVLAGTPTYQYAEVTVDGTAVTVTADNGDTQVYTVELVVNYMTGWNEGETPKEAGWDGPAGNTITWGDEGNNQVSWRRNIGTPINNGDNPILYTTLESTVLNYQISVLPGKKVYRFTCKYWRRNGGETPADFKFTLATDVEGTKPLMSCTETIRTNNAAGTFTTPEFVVPATVNEPLYLLWEVVNKENWQNAGIYDLSLVETADAITVTFDTDGGSEVATQYLMEGDKVLEPETPVKDGFIFSGWYAGGGDEAWDFENETVSADMTLKAKWEKDGTTAVDMLNGESFRVFSVANGVQVQAGQAMSVKVVSVTGQTVKVMDVEAGDTFVSLTPGLYIINGMKTIVK